LDEYVVIPNHIYGIIVLLDYGRNNQLNDPVRLANKNKVGTRYAVSLHEQFGKPVKESLSTTIRLFKSVVTKRINDVNGIPGVSIWQPKFYDHIIRNEKELNVIRDYIANNPIRWTYDEDNPVNNFSGNN
jgi:putative transposase